MKKTIITSAEHVLRNKFKLEGENANLPIEQITMFMIEFAKAHVKAALHAADGEVPHHCSHGVLNAYPPENIT